MPQTETSIGPVDDVNVRARAVGQENRTWACGKLEHARATTCECGPSTDRPLSISRKMKNTIFMWNLLTFKCYPPSQKNILSTMWNKAMHCNAKSMARPFWFTSWLCDIQDVWPWPSCLTKPLHTARTQLMPILVFLFSLQDLVLCCYHKTHWLLLLLSQVQFCKPTSSVRSLIFFVL